MGALGLFAGIFANKFDQMAAITNFIVTPLAFLSGTFYSVEALPPVLNRLTHLNPVFYLIDGLRYGMIGVSDSSPWLGMAVCTFATFVIGAITADAAHRISPQGLARPGHRGRLHGPGCRRTRSRRAGQALRRGAAPLLARPDQPAGQMVADPTRLIQSGITSKTAKS